MSSALLGTARLDGLPRAATEIHQSFLDAAESAGLIDRRFSIAGLHVCMRFAGSVVEATLAPAFAHLATEERREPDLTIHVSDSASSGTRPIDLALTSDDPPGTWQVHLSPETRWGRQVGVDGLTVLAAEHRAAWFWAPDVTALPLFERAAPFRILWHWWLPLCSRTLVHAAAIGNDERGALLVGRGGSGKSTAALASVEAGLRYAADDYVGVSVDPPTAHSIFGSGKIDTDGAWRVPRIASLTGYRSDGHPFDTNKTVVFLGELFAPQLASSFPISAILIPRITGTATDTRIVPGRPADALLALAPSTVLQMPSGGADSLTDLTAFVHRVPSFHLHMGDDVQAVAATISAFLDDPALRAT